MQAGIEWILDNSTKSQNNGIKPVNAAHSGLSHSTLNSLHSITFSIPSQSNVTLTVWNVFGQKIKTVINGVRNAGEHTVSLNASSMSTGMYVLKLEAGNTSYSQRVPFTN